MNYPRRGSGGNSGGIGATKKEIFIQETQPDSDKVSDKGAIWIKVDENKVPYSVYQYDKDSDTWKELNILEQNIVVSQQEPSNKYPNLVWFVLDNSNNISGIKVWDGSGWKNVEVGGGSSSSGDTYKVKATASDTPGFLDSKVDNETIQIKSNKLSVKFQDDKKEDVVWSSQRVTREAIVKAIIFG